MNECQPLDMGGHKFTTSLPTLTSVPATYLEAGAYTRFRLNVSAFYGMGGAWRSCFGAVLRVFRRCRGSLGGVKGVF